MKHMNLVDIWSIFSQYLIFSDINKIFVLLKEFKKKRESVLAATLLLFMELSYFTSGIFHEEACLLV